ncbi:MAG: hypothetical protein JWN92_3080 [Candidatus Acidoferrum typicum]|nr:hypothetical protein [Candidatus Acidoferrum typicum]
MILQGSLHFNLEIELICQIQMNTRMASTVRGLIRKFKATMGICGKQWYFRWMPAPPTHAMVWRLAWHLCVKTEAV